MKKAEKTNPKIKRSRPVKLHAEELEFVEFLKAAGKDEVRFLYVERAGPDTKRTRLVCARLVEPSRKGWPRLKIGTKTYPAPRKGKKKAGITGHVIRVVEEIHEKAGVAYPFDGVLFNLTGGGR